MSWDEEKETFAERPDVPANQKITSTEWNEHVSDQKDHSSRHEETGSDSLGVFDLVGSLTGQGLERVGDSLQVLSSIWDGENITANVDNESVNTDEASINGPLDAESATVDDASVTNTPTTDGDVLRYQERFESGVETDTATLQASTDGWNDYDTHIISVSFDTSWDTPPHPVVTMDQGTTFRVFGYNPYVTNLSTTGFDIDLRYYPTDQSDQQGVRWIAGRGI